MASPVSATSPHRGAADDPGQPALPVPHAILALGERRHDGVLDDVVRRVRVIEEMPGERPQPVGAGRQVAARRQEVALQQLAEQVFGGRFGRRGGVLVPVDPVLDPLLGRLTIKKGKYIKIGDKEVEDLEPDEIEKHI